MPLKKKIVCPWCKNKVEPFSVFLEIQFCSPDHLCLWKVCAVLRHSRKKGSLCLEPLLLSFRLFLNCYREGTLGSAASLTLGHQIHGSSNVTGEVMLQREGALGCQKNSQRAVLSFRATQPKLFLGPLSHPTLQRLGSCYSRIFKEAIAPSSFGLFCFQTPKKKWHTSQVNLRFITWSLFQAHKCKSNQASFIVFC